MTKAFGLLRTDVTKWSRSRRRSGEFLRGEDVRVDLAAEAFPDSREEPGDLAQGHVAEDQEVDVAAGLLGAVGEGPEDEGDADPRGSQRLAKNRREAGGLRDEAPEVGEEGTSGVGSVEGAVAVSPPDEEAQVGQALQLLAHGRVVQAGTSGELADVELAGPGSEEEPQGLDLHTGGEESGQRVQGAWLDHANAGEYDAGYAGGVRRDEPGFGRLRIDAEDGIVRRRIFLRLGALFTLGHLIVAFGSFLVSFGGSMDRLDHPDATHPLSDGLGVLAEILMQPVGAFWDSVPNETIPDYLEWPILVANSSLWGFALAYLSLWIAARRRASASSAS